MDLIFIIKKKKMILLFRNEVLCGLLFTINSILKINYSVFLKTIICNNLKISFELNEI